MSSAAEPTPLERPSAELAVGVVAVALFAIWAMLDGGFEPTAAYPGALLLLGLLAVTVFAYRRQRRAVFDLPGAASLALAVFVTWSFLSIIWANSPGDAWEGADRALIYLLVFVLFAIPVWQLTSAAWTIGLYSFAVATIGIATLADVSSSLDPALSFLDGRLVGPLGYHNASAALFLMAFWPATLLASRRELPIFLRAAMLAAAGVLIELAVLPQSRGGLIATAITLVIYLVLVPNRVRAALWLLPPLLALALSAAPLLDVYEAVQAGDDIGGSVAAALRAVCLSAAGLVIGGLLLAAADRRIAIPERTRERVGRVAGVGTAAIAILAVVVAVVAIGNPVSWAEDRWDDFRGGYSAGQFDSSRFGGSLGSNRYDFWRVGWGEFEESPLLGIGMDNFAIEYLQERDSDEEPRHPHSLPIKLISQTGIPGALAFAGFVALAGAAALRTRTRAGTGLERALAAAAMTSFAYWLVHSSGDWLWTFPALGAPAVAWLAIAGRLGSGAEAVAVESPQGAAPARRWRMRVLVAAGAALWLLAVASYVAPWRAAVEIERASAAWGRDPERAYDQLARARELNPLSDRADVIGAAIAARLGDSERSRAYFAAALDRNPHNWYALLALGALEAESGERREALRHMRESSALNPRDDLIRRMRWRVAHDRPVSLRRIDEVLLARTCKRVGRTKATARCP